MPRFRGHGTLRRRGPVGLGLYGGPNCLEKLLWELGAWEISTVWLESRTASLNRRDLKLVDAWRSQGKLPATQRIEIGLPSTEPMLWIPDAVAGAVAAARKGRPAHRDMLGDIVLDVEFDL